MTHSRRDFVKLLSGAGAVTAFGALGIPLTSCAKANGRVVIIGGGFGGSTCAKYIHRYAPNIQITLIEQNKKFITCPFSNTVIGGLRDIDKLTYNYDNLRNKHQIQVVHDVVTGIDPVSKKVHLKNGKQVDYDRLVVSPGIDFRWDDTEGSSEAASQLMTHAWKAGPQTITLRKQLEAMKNGGVVIIAPPANPFRCPPGPYERASMIAHYLKQHKPKSKILILDAKDKFSKQPLFMQGWETLYPGMIEWVKGTKGGRIERIDAKTKSLYNEVGDEFKGDVVNFIPPQKAGLIAQQAGLVDKTGWCSINQRTFESDKFANIHVIGDASLAGSMPKSGFSANSQGKVCAAAVASSLLDVSMPEPSYSNTCYSLVGPDYGISVAAVYRLSDNKIAKVKGSGGISPKLASADFRKMEANYTRGWYANITADVFG
ncbi:FAD-dependent oxidoreductase [Beggiatoa alba]|nr:FAD-dependent oxidoreductase [Beggiatoa alba]